MAAGRANTGEWNNFGNRLRKAFVLPLILEGLKSWLFDFYFLVVFTLAVGCPDLEIVYINYYVLQ